ncbi:MAG: HAD family hydrolase [Myxococcales bacterium]|nr:HAD family hydrolase [Myxococcales bacterium]
MTTRCVVFDVDDTLYLERDYAHSGFAAVGREVERRWGVAGFGAQAWNLFQDGARGDIFDRVLQALGLTASPDDVRTLVVCYREHSPAIGLLPDARQALDRLNRTYVLAGLTDGPVASQRAKVAALGLSRWLDPIVVTGELGPGAGKPSPAGFRRIEAASGVDGAACVYVADNPAKDFAGPRALGWKTVRVRRPGGLHVDAPSGDDVDAEIGTLDALDPLLVPG